MEPLDAKLTDLESAKLVAELRHTANPVKYPERQWLVAYDKDLKRLYEGWIEFPFDPIEVGFPSDGCTFVFSTEPAPDPTKPLDP